MIKIYQNGEEFYNDNKDFLLQNKHIEAFFRLDSPLLKEVNKEEYALKVYDDVHTLAVLLKEPYNLLLYGDKELTNELVDFLVDNNYKIKNYLCDTVLGDELLKSFNKKGIPFVLSIGMDFMDAHNKYPIDTSIVEPAKEEDLEEIFPLIVAFYKDCGLNDAILKDKIKERLLDFRVIRKDGHIISMAKLGSWTPEEMKVSYVYTKDEYRGMGYAKIVVAHVLNEIIDRGYIATLNVDQKNPISYHIYSSLGFKKIFSQGVYVKK